MAETAAEAVILEGVLHKRRAGKLNVLVVGVGLCLQAHKQKLRLKRVLHRPSRGISVGLC